MQDFFFIIQSFVFVFIFNSTIWLWRETKKKQQNKNNAKYHPDHWLDICFIQDILEHRLTIWQIKLNLIWILIVHANFKLIIKQVWFTKILTNYLCTKKIISTFKDEQIIQWMCLIKHGFIIQLKKPQPVIHMLTDHE